MLGPTAVLQDKVIPSKFVTTLQSGFLGHQHIVSYDHGLFKIQN